ncbi:leader peptidase (prepilin peptidase)/N-methyltransferase [Arthrobacter pigmenti]|uniref:Leader peptidase (Prepilin peptidase)/N-methyltransferase n=1 Tax=Arthrobacter pigmenti TaxID=271432 RepID=A0A846RN44_9MICC|nr:A24 family peptidase [Arthrobacter pigmenti]NJC21734.1 leader peptidase (prepilin peptidase)/N-methyltransferase [Arthrobacter pigmenti]
MLALMGEYWGSAPVAFWLCAAALALLAVVGIWLSIIDILTHRLPNRIIFPSYPAAAVLLIAAALAVQDWNRLVSLAGGAAALWVFYFLLRLIYPAGMGFGDVKLAGLLGLYLGFAGWPNLLWGTFAAFLLGGLWGVLLIVSRRGTAKSAIPFGPFMIVGAFLVLALG